MSSTAVITTGGSCPLSVCAGCVAFVPRWRALPAVLRQQASRCIAPACRRRRSRRPPLPRPVAPQELTVKEGGSTISRFQTRTHVTTCDAQPSGESGVLVFVTGNMEVRTLARPRCRKPTQNPRQDKAQRAAPSPTRRGGALGVHTGL